MTYWEKIVNWTYSISQIYVSLNIISFFIQGFRNGTVVLYTPALFTFLSIIYSLHFSSFFSPFCLPLSLNALRGRGSKIYQIESRVCYGRGVIKKYTNIWIHTAFYHAPNKRRKDVLGRKRAGKSVGGKWFILFI